MIGRIGGRRPAEDPQARGQHTQEDENGGQERLHAGIERLLPIQEIGEGAHAEQDYQRIERYPAAARFHAWRHRQQRHGRQHQEGDGFQRPADGLLVAMEERHQEKAEHHAAAGEAGTARQRRHPLGKALPHGCRRAVDVEHRRAAALQGIRREQRGFPQNRIGQRPERADPCRPVVHHPGQERRRQHQQEQRQHQPAAPLQLHPQQHRHPGRRDQHRMVCQDRRRRAQCARRRQRRHPPAAFRRRRPPYRQHRQQQRQRGGQRGGWRRQPRDGGGERQVRHHIGPRRQQRRARAEEHPAR